jgi:cellulose synthase/poly-beta-1,6-N-acetylglucosamine synthase-like glycosyltransferase
MDAALRVINDIVLAYFLAVNFIYTLLLLLSVRETRQHGRRARFGGYDVILRSSLTLPVSVLMPAYNEESTIVQAVQALRTQKYGEFEIVVIDDGSTDSTLDRLIDAFRLEKVDRPIRLTLACGRLRGVYVSRSVDNLTVLAKENGGKADALNAGVDAARFPLVCAIDADAILEKDALLRVVKPFMDRPRETVASSGIVRVVNGCIVRDGTVREIRPPRTGLATLQVVEYLRAFLANRMGWSRLHSLFVISGAFGVFKKEAVLQVGGYRTDTVGEDMDLVLRLHGHYRDSRERYRIVFIPDPVVWTEAPETLVTLHRQRNRWHRGLLECLWASRRMMGRPKYGPVGLFGLPYNLVFEAIGPLVEVAGYAVLAVSIALGAVNVPFVVLFFLLAVGYGVFLSVAAILLDLARAEHYGSRRALGRLLVFALLESFGYRQLQAVWRVQATVDFLRKKQGWGEMRRLGFESGVRPSPRSETPSAAR